MNTKITTAFLLFFFSLSAIADTTPKILISPLANYNWQVEYRFGYPVESLQFMRSMGYLREENWQVQTPGYRFARSGDVQFLVRDESAEPADAIVIEFPVETRFILRDYELFNRFFDGSLMLFTGHFYVQPAGKKVPDQQQLGFLTKITLSPPKGKQIGIQGQLTSKAVTWIDKTGEGTYAYIGNTPATETESVITVFDKGLPSWVSQQAQQRIPELLALYTKRMGPHSAVKPLVLFSYEPDAQQTYGYNGGVRNDLIQLRVSGSSWQQESTGPMISLIQLFAHEAAHLWNGQAVSSAPNTSPWIHEGSADALAERALVDLGLIASSVFWQHQEAALNSCISGLKAEKSLLSTTQHRLHYTCGNFLSLWAERALQSVSRDKDLFDIWRNLIENSPSGTFDQSSYFDSLRTMGVTPKHTGAMQDFVSRSHKNPVQALKEAFEPLGIILERDDQAASTSAVIQMSAQLLTALLKNDCGSGYGFYTHPHHFTLSGLSGCQSAYDGLEVTHIENTAIAAPGFLAYQTASTACIEKGKVEIGNSQQKISLPCTTKLPDLEGWWRINVE